MFDFFSPERLQLYAIMAPGLLIALILHEVAHGYVAYLLGDPTAKAQGRLSLNPLKHLDPIGTLAFFFVRFGWAKPVPINPRYFKNPRQGMMLTAMAGPLTNFVLAALFAMALHAMPALGVPPGNFLFLACYYGVFVNLILGAFNLIPIPPLDGSNVLAYFLPPRMAYKYTSFGRYGFILLIGLIVVSNFTRFSLFGEIILPFVSFMAGLFGVPM
jgi:Zn-dependent protease